LFEDFQPPALVGRHEFQEPAGRARGKAVALVICQAPATDYDIGMSGVAEIKTGAGGLVVSNPAILGGTPIFRGTRLPVRTHAGASAV